MSSEASDKLGSPGSPPSPLPEPKHALAQVRDELLVMPVESVEYPLENVGLLAEQALALAKAARAQGHAEDEVARLELLSQAASGAQGAYGYAHGPEGITDFMLPIHADEQFLAVYRFIDGLVKKGGLTRAELPRVPGFTLRDRGIRILALIAFLREKGFPTKLKLDGIERTAHRIRQHTGTERPETPAINEMRDRAYTALRQAYDRALKEWGTSAP